MLVLISLLFILGVCWVIQLKNLLIICYIHLIILLIRLIPS